MYLAGSLCHLVCVCVCGWGVGRRHTSPGFTTKTLLQSHPKFAEPAYSESPQLEMALALCHLLFVATTSLLSATAGDWKA